MTGIRKKDAAPCSLNGADTASFKLEQKYFLTQFILQTHLDDWIARYNEERLTVPDTVLAKHQDTFMESFTSRMEKCNRSP